MNALTHLKIKFPTNYSLTNHTYNVYGGVKQDLPLDNHQGLICH